MGLGLGLEAAMGTAGLCTAVCTAALLCALRPCTPCNPSGGGGAAPAPEACGELPTPPPLPPCASAASSAMPPDTRLAPGTPYVAGDW